MEETKNCKWYNDDDIIKGLECLAGHRACNLCKYDDLAMQDGERTCVNIVAEEAIKLIKDLKDEKEEIRLFNLSLQNGEVDMTIESEMAKSFYNSIVQVFEQNGAKNFFTTTIDIEGKKGRYAFTIEKVGGKTVAEKLAEQNAELESLKEEKYQLEQNLKQCENGYEQELHIERYKAGELQKQVEELKAKNEHLDSENIRLICEMDKMLDYGWDIMDKEAEICYNSGYAQGVEDTAKEIFDRIFETICVFTTQGKSEEYNKGFLDAVSEIDERLQKLAKDKGVEVE